MKKNPSAFAAYKKKARAGQRAINKRVGAAMRATEYGVDPAQRKRRAKNPVHDFQVVRWNDGHAWFWNGARWTANRSDAAIYRTVPTAKAVARAVKVRCAVVTRTESLANIERFLTGRSPKA